MQPKSDMFASNFYCPIVPRASAAATINGTAIDQDTLATDGGPYAEAVAHILVGAATGTPDAVSVVQKWQQSVDNSNWTDITDTDQLVEAATVTVGAVSTNGRNGLRLKGCARYVRPSVTITFTNGSTPTVGIAVGVSLRGARRI